MPRPATRADAIDAVAAVARQLPGRTAFVGIDGFGAAGKTSLAHAIAAAIDRVSVVHVDDFAGPGIAEWDWMNFRAQVLDPLLAGRTARYRGWDWDRDADGEWVEIGSGRVVVVEGVSSTRAEAGAPWDLTIWVDAPLEVRRQRARRRDGPRWEHRWRTNWIPSEQAYAARENPRARVDLIVDGAAGPELS